MKLRLDPRQEEVLSLLVTDYIQKAGAIASGHIAGKLPRRLSPATVRSILADLETQGYLSQPHTSSGRVPTQQGLRYFVDSLLIQREPGNEEKEAILRHLHPDNGDLPALLKKAGQILSLIAHQASLVATPKMEKTVFKQMEFIPLSGGRILGIFVAQNGIVENRVLRVDEELNYGDLEKMNNYVNARFVGLPLEAAREKVVKELESVCLEYDRLLGRALLFSRELFAEIPSRDLMVEGESNLYREPEFSRGEDIAALQETLREKNLLLKLLESSLDAERVRIFIGRESRLPRGTHLSVIAAQYRCRGEVVGTLGVVGPTRMDYSKVIPIVDFTAHVVSDLLSHQP